MADRETIIETGGGGGMAIIAGIVLAVVLVLGFLWIVNNNGGGSGTLDVDVRRFRGRDGRAVTPRAAQAALSISPLG